MRPKVETAFSTAAATSLSDETSAWTKIALLSPWPISAMVSRPASSFTSTATTFAPMRAKRTAVARPMPKPAPVTNATFPVHEAMGPPPAVLSSDWGAW